jgi:hypothetical protein
VTRYPIGVEEKFLPFLLLAEVHSKQKNYPVAIRDIDAYLVLDPISENADRLKELREKLKALERK